MNIHPPRIKKCYCIRCGTYFVGGMQSRVCQKCYKPMGRNNKNKKWMKEKK